MNAIVIFLNENYKYIAIIITIIISLLVYISFNNIELNKPTNKKLIQSVTVETFVNDSDLKKGEDQDLNTDKSVLFQSNSATINTKKETDIDFDGARSFCENYRGNSGELNKAAADLTDDNCKTSSCCVLVQGQNGNTCMAGDINGPTFKKDLDGNLISMDAYYYQGKRYPVSPTTV